LRKLRQYWQSLFASKNKSVKTPADSSPGPEKLEREIAAVSSVNQALSADLEEVRQEIAAARNADKHKLAELERASHTLEIARQEEVTKRNELENRLDEIASERNQARDQIRGLKISLAEASTRLENTGNQFRQLELEQRLHEKMLLETQTQLRTQDQRLSWTMMVAGFAVVLAAVSGVILILEAHKNAALLTGMNADMQQLLTSMGQHLDTRHQAVAETPVTATAVTPATTTTAKAADQDNPAATTDSGALPEEATDAAGNAASSAYLPAPPVLDDRQKHSRMLSTPRKKPVFNEAGVDWTMANLPGGMLYRVETAGRGRSPDMTDRVVVNYLIVKPDGKVIDDTYSSGQPATLHMSELAPALQEALLHMGEGAEWEVTVPELQQYQGTQGSEPGLYLIELIEVIEGEVPDPSMPPE
jgi:hypothetical protein